MLSLYLKKNKERTYNGKNFDKKETINNTNDTDDKKSRQKRNLKQ